MTETFENILAGIRQWVNNKFEEVTYVIALSLNSLNSRVTNVENNKQDNLTTGDGISIDSGNTISVVGKADGSIYQEDGDGNAHITKPLNVSGSVAEGSPYGEVVEINVMVLTPEQKAEVEAATGTAYDYCDTLDNIPDGINVTIYADEECTQKVGSTVKTEYTEAVFGGEDVFNLQEGESIAAGIYYARIERGTLGFNSHAEGNGTTASGYASHAEGEGTIASGQNSHAEGQETTASGNVSHAEGMGTIASQNNQHVCGKYNVEDTDGDYAFIVGNGTANDARSNAFAIDWNGNLVLFNAGTPVVLTPAKLAALIA